MDIVSRYKDSFCNAAIAKGDGTLSNDGELFSTMKATFTRLYNHPSGSKHICMLLRHDNDWVKSWVASQILSEGKSKDAEQVLIKLKAKNGVLGFNAEMVLEQYKNGELKCPFAIKP